jgi:hypothetical protein
MDSASAREALIPIYVRDRNDAARRAGLEVGLSFKAAEPDQHDGYVYSTWLGSAAQFEACGMRIQMSDTWRRPRRSGRLGCAFFYAESRREGDDTFSMLIGDELPRRQFLWRGITAGEIHPWHYSSRIWYHGTAADLVEAGIMKRLTCAPPGQANGRFITSRSGWDGEVCSWSCRLCFDGKVVFQRDEYTEAVRRKRQANRRTSDGSLEAGRQEQRIERQLQARTIAAAKQDDTFQAFLRRLSSGRQ